MKTVKSAPPRFIVACKRYEQWVGNPGVEFGALTITRAHAERFLDEDAAKACARALNYVDAREGANWEVEPE